MIDSRKTKKYSDSLISVSDKLDHDIRLVTKNLLLFNNHIKELSDLRYLIMSKRISVNSKLTAIKNIFSSTLEEIELEFISLLVSNGDISFLGNIIEKLNFTIEMNSNVKNIHITSANDFKEDEKNEIVELIKNKFSIDNSSKATFDVDKNIIGGITIRIGNKIIDGSIVTKLKKIKQSLLSI